MEVFQKKIRDLRVPLPSLGTNTPNECRPLHHRFWPLGHKTVRAGRFSVIEARFYFLILGSA
jgi:hypothetical protein